MTFGVDYAWTHPKPAALRAAGAQFALRYLSADRSKNLSRTEADALAAEGIWSGVVWETTAGRALDGYAAGAADAQAASRQAAACGMPDSRPIYFAVDTDTTWPRVLAYFEGVASVLPAARIGVYGGIRIVSAAADSGLVRWLWQASAWSGGRWDPRAHVRQLGYVTIGGVQCDRNEATTADYGQWMPGRTPALHQEEEDDMPYTPEQIGSAVANAAFPVYTDDGTFDRYEPLYLLIGGFDIANRRHDRLLGAIQAKQAAQDAILTTLLDAAPSISTQAVVDAVNAAVGRVEQALKGTVNVDVTVHGQTTGQTG